MLQGVPLGLAMGSIPFLLKKRLNFADMATFSLAAYPYSLKVFLLGFATVFMTVASHAHQL
jgi:hypothetical protein